MDHVTLTDGMGAWIPPEHLAEGQTPETVRFEQSGRDAAQYRPLTSAEIQRLTDQGNQAADWTQVLVSDPFDAACLRHNEFYGLVRLGRMQQGALTHQGMALPTGIFQSRIESCDLGHDMAIHDVSYLGHVLVGDRVILFQCGEIRTTCCAKFGTSQIKPGDAREAFARIHVMNEAGARGIGLFRGVLPADAMLWARSRSHPDLMARLETLTCDLEDRRCGVYSEIQSQCVIKHTRQLINVKLGPCTEVIGADRLEEVTLCGTEAEPVTVADSVTLRQGQVGPGCLIRQGVHAELFCLGAYVTLECGARLRHTVVGDNSSIAGCEVLHSLIFPGHRQQHSSSFLTASCLMGQTNVAAGAIIGSNHNSRANDSELCAGRGFWPGLCSSVKHPSRFASFVLLAKGDFPHELNITLPFSLVINDPAKDQLKVMPAYWWRYNMYALARNAVKFRERDLRQHPGQAIEYHVLAPDTIGEIQQARAALEVWVAQAHLRALGRVETDIETLSSKGQHLLSQATVSAPDMDVTARGLEHALRSTVILHAFEGYHAYGEMLLHYGVIHLMEFLQWHGGGSLEAMVKALSGGATGDWANLGGQLMPVQEVQRLQDDICSSTLTSWSEVHDRYEALWKAYPLVKQQHAYATLCDVLGVETLDHAHWYYALDQSMVIQKSLCDRVQSSRQRDFENPFMQALFESPEEMRAVMGHLEDNAFIQEVRAQTEVYATQVQRFKELD
ncbi:MAG: DUF4954 family protein [Phycisphaerae bacterium]|nr:DUF4954 family protein [Phycisphaerae bacterium]